MELTHRDHYWVLDFGQNNEAWFWENNGECVTQFQYVRKNLAAVVKQRERVYANSR